MNQRFFSQPPAPLLAMNAAGRYSLGMKRHPLFAIVALAIGELAAAPYPSAFSVDESTDLLEFDYAWPVEAAAVPALDHWLRGDMTKAKRDAIEFAREDREAARESEREFQKHSLSRQWTSAGWSPRLLSLEGATYTYSGGAHPNHSAQALLWDQDHSRAIKPEELFQQDSSLADLMRALFCKALDSERLERRQGEKFGGSFDECPKFTDLAIVPTDTDRDQRFDTIRFIASSYVAGPYVEGEYEIALPLHHDFGAKLKPEYRASFEAQPQ